MLMREIATQLYTANRMNDPDHFGLKGLAAGFIFSALARRTPMGAALFAGALIARRLYRAGQAAKAQQVDREAAILPPNQADRIAANGPAARRPIDRSATPPKRGKLPLATLH